MQTYTTTYKGDITLFFDSLLKSWLAVAVVIMSIKQAEIAGAALLMMAVRAALNGLNPIYLGLSSVQVQESRIIKNGLPVVLILAAIYLAQTLYFYQ